MPCPICHGNTKHAFDALVLGHHEATYSRCTQCGFLSADDPVWLEEAYSAAINDIDLGVINRATTSSGLIEGLILSCFDRNGQFVDYGGGYGVLVRLMRDRGFDFWWTDRYCENLFAKTFEAQPGSRYEMVTAFEVFEHLVDPLAEVEDMLALSDNILFTTLLQPEPLERPEDWWYIGPEHGQHIAFYTLESLRALAKAFDLHLCSDGVDTHLLSRRLVSQKRFSLFAAGGRRARVTRKLLRRRMDRQTLLDEDFRQVSGYDV